ncbi:SKA complex subunit 2-like [Littorina saxatilis]|uniref:Protein FAM33A n=1 Tax=Littorina saxatilis TaxID=31220 RepID=A0AAN9AID8_9CAEN
MEAASGMLEAKFQKAESDLNHLTRKLELRCQDSAQGDNRKNPLELLRKVNAVKDEYKALVRESAEIQKAQTEAMEFFRSQLPVALQALQQLQQAVGMGGTEEDKAKVEELQGLLGVQSLPQPTQQTNHIQGMAETPAQSQDASDATQPVSSSSRTDSKEGCDAKASAKFVEDPVALRSTLRAESDEFVEVNQEEFESVSELIRGRVKLSEVNAVYRGLYRHFKEENNSNVLNPADMHKMGMRVSGATGKAKLKVLRALKLLTMSSKEEVKLL